VLDALAAEEGSSSEDTSDEAYCRLHKPLEEDEHIRLNGPTGARQRLFNGQKNKIIEYIMFYLKYKNIIPILNV
jgi:hypothetical protein